ncbi:MAG: M81 family metallopeptidase [Acidobacteria bacterium]|nr:M81 family metallopeptidase [Acidobacteriota bacterium]MCI0724514.1 M81 family metallopeptidase [Acidobacteriota bacterium]
MKRVGIAGFLHESNTFLSVATTREHFEQASLTKGPGLLERWEGSSHELGGFLEGARRFGFAPVPTLATYAIPSGAIQSVAFDELLDEMVEELRKALPLDGLLVALHGATVAENFPDADGEILRRLRQVVGSDIPIIATLDLHANVSPKMVAHTNATVIYRSNPHLDQKERGLEAAELMARTLTGQIQPVQALKCPPLLISISKQDTSQSPALGLYEDALEVMTWPGILSASVAMGFYYADVEEMGASFLAVADKNRELAVKAARWMVQRAWERRQDFVGQLLSPAEAVRRAAQSAAAPIVLMDVGDNVGGGSAGDSTILLHEILKHGVSNALVVLYDPESVTRCVAAGVRQPVALQAGAKTDQLHGKPVPIQGKVRLISDGVFVETQVRHGGWGLNDQGITAVVETEQQHTMVFTSRRMAPMSLEQLLSLGLKPERKKILIVKGVIAPRAAYEPVAAEIILVDTPGSTSANPSSFTFHYRRHPLYPLEPDAEYQA